MTARLLALYRDAYRGLPRDAWMLSLVTFVHRSGTMVMPFLALFATTQRGFTPAEAGNVLSVWGLGAVLGADLGGRLSDRAGALRAQQISLVAAGLGFLALGAAPSGALYVAVFLASCASESFRPSNGAALAEMSPPGGRYRAFALRRLAINAGMTFGPAIGGFLATVDYHYLFIANACGCWSAAVLLHLGFPRGFAPVEPSPGAPSPAPAALEARSPFADAGFREALLLVLLLITLFFQLFGSVPVYLHDVLSLNERTIGVTMAVNTLIIIAFEMPLLQAVRRVVPFRVVGTGCLLIGAGLSLLAPARSVPAVVLAIAVVTCGEMLTLPLLEGWVAERASPRLRGRYMGLYQSTIAVAMILSPLVGLRLYGRFGPTVLWTACAGAGLALMAGFWFLANRRRERPGSSV